MKRISISDDIIPLSEFKSSLSKWIRTVQKTGHPLIITHNGRPTGVLISPAEYDELVHTKSFIDSVERGMEDAESGKVHHTKDLKAELEKRRTSRMNK